MSDAPEHGLLGLRPTLSVEDSVDAAAYSRALRHSVRVRFLKRAIPFGATLAIGVIAVIGVLDPFGRLGGLELGPVSLSGTKVTMEQPTLTGYRKDGRRYQVAAVSAAQDVRKPNIIELTKLTARFILDGDKAADLEADFGLYDTQSEKLKLKDQVRVRTESGYEAWLSSADADFKAGAVVSNDPVRVAMTNGTIEADRLDVRDNGRIIVFEGRVRAVLTGDQAQTAPLQASAGTR